MSSETENKNVFTSLAESGYESDRPRVVELGRIYAAGGIVAERVGTTYLRVLTSYARGCARASGHDAKGAVEQSHKRHLPLIISGITTPDVQIANSGTPECLHMNAAQLRDENKRRSLERNRRSNFARTAASALRKYVLAGGDLSAIPLDEVTKSWLTTHTPTKAEAAAVPDRDADTVSPAAIHLARATKRHANEMARGLRKMAAAGFGASAQSIATAVAKFIAAEFPAANT